MAEPPGRADQRRAAQGALPADDRGDRDHVVGIGRVAHPEEEAEQQAMRPDRCLRLTFPLPPRG